MAAVGALTLIALWLVVVLVWTRGERESALIVAPAADGIAPASDAPSPRAPEIDVTALDETAGPPLEAPIERVEVARTPAAARGECRLFGVVVDESDQPIDGVTAVLVANDGEMKRESRTNSAGEFELFATLPDKRTCFVAFSCDGRESVSRRIVMSRKDEALKPGDNDLGRFVLRSTGRIEGRVVLRDGTPVPYIPVRILDASVASSSTGSDGSYRIEGVPGGQRSLEAEDEGQVRVDVRPGQSVRAPDLVLSARSLVAGQVVDESGAPRRRAMVRAHPSNAQSSSAWVAETSDSTDSDGRFCVLLSAAAPQELVASWPAHPVGPQTVEGPVYAAGSTNVRLVLTDLPKSLFTVVDATTGEPVGRFGLRLAEEREEQRAPDGRFRGATTTLVRVEDHTGGTCELEVGPESAGIQVMAPGYAPFEDWLAPEARTGGLQSIRLTRGASLVGRIVVGGKPARGATVRLRRAVVARVPASSDASTSGVRVSRRDPSPSDDEREPPPLVDAYDLSAFEGRSLSDSTDRDGTFRIDDLAAGTYQLEARTSRGARRRIESIRVAAGATLDIGEVRLVEGATVRGRVLLPHGASAEGLRLLSDGGGVGQPKCDADGRFELEGVPAGRWSVVVPATEGLVAAGPPFVFDLIEGEEREVVLDVRDREGAWLTVLVLVNGEPIRGAWVWLRAQGEEVAAPGFRSTDARGTMRTWGTPTSYDVVDVRSSQGLPLAHVEGAPVLGGKAGSEVLIEVEAATLVVDATGLSGLADSRVLEVAIDSKSDARLNASVRSFVGYTGSRGTAQDSVRREDLGPIAAGDYDVSLTIARIELGGVGEPLMFRKTIHCRPREVAECAFTDADRISIDDAAAGSADSTQTLDDG